jgi:hypothetical protein
MNPVLVDTSVWVDHFRRGNPQLAQLLQQDMVLMHPMVLGELACGTPPARARTLADLQRLRPARQASMREVLGLIEREQLFGLGCGLGPVHTNVGSRRGRAPPPTKPPPPGRVALVGGVAPPGGSGLCFAGVAGCSATPH